MIKTYTHSNQGSSLPAVIMIMLIVITLASVVVSLAVAQTNEEIYYENNLSALHAAEAGLNQYLWYLNKESGTPIAFDTVINYPEGNAVAAFKLVSITDGQNRKEMQSTGWMLNDPSVMRTVTTTFNKRSFTEYMYFSDNDPAEIYWTSAENCYGPYHTNTALCSMGHPTFWGKATSVTGIKYYQNKQSANSPVFKKGYEQVASITMPTSNSEIMSYGMASEGYYYEGRTSILLNSNGTITVWNPNHTPAIETRSLPENGVIYVNEKSGTNYNDKFDPDNGNVFISGVLDGRLTVAAMHDIYITGYDPTVANLSSASSTDGIIYKDSTFSLDTSTGIVTCNETAGVEEGDMLGLIANENIGILTQGWFTGNASLDSSRVNFKIYAAVMAINGSFINSMFMVNPVPATINPSSGGTLNVRGSIIQNTRGAVGRTYGSGYSKNYAHDPRMDYDSPPYFLSPENSGWEIIDWNE